MERGEVYYLRYDDSYGHEMATGRPVVVISSDVGIDRCEVVTIAYLTSKYKQININVEVNCTPRRSWVLCNQLATVDKRRLGDRMCKLSPSELEEVDEKLCDALGLWGVIKEVEVEKIVEVAAEKPICEDTEKIRLQIELDLYKKLYSDLTSQIVDARFDRQVVVTEEVEEKPVVVETPVVEVEVDEKSQLNIEDLAKKMSTPNIELDEPPKKKMGRPVGSKSKAKPKKKKAADRVAHDELVGFKKKGKVNINKDSWEVIAATTGMSPQTAHEIEKWRNKNGDFIDLTDLLFVPRFGSGCMNKYGQMLEV